MPRYIMYPQKLTHDAIARLFVEGKYAGGIVTLST